MVSARTRAWLSTFALVLGALLVGDALHGAVTTSQYGITSPAAVFRFVAGGLFIFVGYRLRTPVEEYVATPSETTREESAEAAETAGDYEPELSPLGGGAPGETARDREREREDGDGGGAERQEREQDAGDSPADRDRADR